MAMNEPTYTEAFSFDSRVFFLRLTSTDVGFLFVVDLQPEKDGDQLQVCLSNREFIDTEVSCVLGLPSSFFPHHYSPPQRAANQQTTHHQSTIFGPCRNFSLPNHRFITEFLIVFGKNLLESILTFDRSSAFVELVGKATNENFKLCK
jgi:hypothetical protein